MRIKKTLAEYHFGIAEGTVFIKLPNGKIVTIDECDLDLLFSAAVSSLYTDKTDHVFCRRKDQGIIPLHQLIMGTDYLKDGLVCDHITGNPLRNTRDNLQVCTNVENLSKRKLRLDTGITKQWSHKEKKIVWAVTILGQIKTFDNESSAESYNRRERHSLNCKRVPIVFDKNRPAPRQLPKTPKLSWFCDRERSPKSKPKPEPSGWYMLSSGERFPSY